MVNGSIIVNSIIGIVVSNIRLCCYCLGKSDKCLLGCFEVLLMWFLINRISLIIIISCKFSIVVWFKLKVLYLIKIMWVKVLKFIMVGVLKLDSV